MIPDRSTILTEQRNPRTKNLHALDIAACVATIQAEDRTIADAMDRARPALTALIQAIEPRFLAGGRLIYVGAGTSGRLAVLDASEAPPTFQLPPNRIIALIAGGDAALRTSSEGKEDDTNGSEPDLRSFTLTPNDSILAIAAGGTTPYALGALALAKTLTHSTPLTALLSCSPVPHPAHADHLVVIDTGPEVLTGSTRMKAGTATKLALNTISTTLMIRSGRVYENLMVDVRATNAKLKDRAARIVSTLTGLSRQDSFMLLDRAGGSAKVAIVMQRLTLTRQEAQARLHAATGRLDRIL